jgi:hypothetical protein
MVGFLNVQRFGFPTDTMNSVEPVISRRYRSAMEDKALP